MRDKYQIFHQHIDAQTQWIKIQVIPVWLNCNTEQNKHIFPEENLFKGTNELCVAGTAKASEPS